MDRDKGRRGGRGSSKSSQTSSTNSSPGSVAKILAAPTVAELCSLLNISVVRVVCCFGAVGVSPSLSLSLSTRRR